VRRSFMSALLLVSFALPAARADFVVAAPRPSARAPASAPDIAPAPGPNEASEHAGAAETSPASSLQPRFRLAQGFGHQIPLGFAIRQLVPPAVRVTYGPGADPDALVDWKGGQGWNQVLFRAVHPLGLHLVMTYMAVQIRNSGVK
jgi:hypothetical protein